MKKIGILVENRLPPNIKKLLLNLGRMLHKDFELDIIGKFSPPQELLNYFDHQCYTGEPNVEGFQRIKQGYLNCREYCLNHEPDALFQIIIYPIYAPIVTFIGNDLDIPTAVRVPEDTFYEYKVRKHDILERTKILLMNNLIGRYPLKSADRVMVLTEYLKDEMIKKGCPEKKIRVIPQPIDTTKFSQVDEQTKTNIRNQLNLPQKDKIALTVGRLDKIKGLDLLDKALNKINIDSLKFCLVGKGPYGKILKNKYPDKVIYVGKVPFEDVEMYYKASDLLIHPSSLEGLPNVVLEAQASGLPVLAKKANYTKDLNVHTFKDEDQLLSLLEKDLQYTPLPDKLNWDTLKSTYIDFFNNLID